MKPILILGGLGYIGSRLGNALKSRGLDIEIIDMDIYGQGNGLMYEELPTSIFRDKVIVNLASFHREAADAVNLDNWARQYGALMIEEPEALSECAHKLIQVSSMRSLYDKSIYGRSKSLCEQKLSSMPNVQHVRFGTVWGGFSDNMPNRFSTAVNFALSRGYFEGSEWAAPVTHMDKVIMSLETYVLAHAKYKETIFDGTVVNVVDNHEPMTSDELRSLLRYRHDDENLQELFDKERMAFHALQDPDLRQDEFAQHRGWNRYGLRRTSTPDLP